jgi:hypothetical protein
MTLIACEQHTLAAHLYPLLPLTATAASSSNAVIVGDDADLILMALVSSTPRLHILNSALGDEKNLSPQSAVLSVDKLHAVWQAGVMTGKFFVIYGVSVCDQILSE